MAVLVPSAPAATDRPRGTPAYVSSSGRDLRLDFLRGLCVIGMIVDHIAGASWLYSLTGGNRFYTSAAEGFVFVSGLVAGGAYTRFILRDGFGHGLGRLINRAAQLYVLAVVLTLIFAPASELLHLPWAFGWNLHDSTEFVVGVITLHITYYMVDVLLLYVLVLLSATVAFVLLLRGQVLLVLGASWLVWLAYQVFPNQLAMPWPIAGNNLFNFAAWQVLFFTGLVIGYQAERGTLPRLPNSERVLRIAAIGCGCAILLYLFQDQLLGLFFRDAADPDSARTALVTSIFGKSDLRAGRVVVFGLLFTTFYLGVTRFWPTLRRWSGWLVLPLGQNALLAYSAHVLLALGIGVVLQSNGGINAPRASTNALIQIGAVLVIWLVVRLRSRRFSLLTPQLRLAAPVVFGLAAVIALPRIAPDTGQPPTGTADAAPAPSTAAAQVARAFGTAIPANTEPALEQAASAPPQPQVAGVSAPSSATGPLAGTLSEPEFFSAALNTNERYFVYLPPNYHAPGQRFPVLYMLHGGGGRQEWVNYDLIGVADRNIAAGKLPPLIIVLPQGDQGYWVNHVADKGPKWGDYFDQDLIHHIDSTYATLPDARHRAVGGLSMGGWGALYQAFTHPDEFGVVGAHAASLRSGDGSMPFLPKGTAFNQFDPVQLAASAPGLEKLRVWIDADDQDPWLKRDQDLHTKLDQRHISNEWHQFPGRHGGTYWQEHDLDYLTFYARALTTPSE